MREEGESPERTEPEAGGKLRLGHIIRQRSHRTALRRVFVDGYKSSIKFIVCSSG